MSYDELGTTLSDLYGIWQDGEKSENKDSESAHKMTKSAEIGELDEHVRQLEHDVEMWRDRAEDMRMERDELQQTIDEMVTELDSARAKNCRLSKKWREKCEAMKAERDELQEKNDELQEKNRHLAQKCDTMLVLLSNRAMDAKSDQERRIEKLVRQRDELRVKLKEIGGIVNG